MPNVTYIPLARFGARVGDYMLALGLALDAPGILDTNMLVSTHIWGLDHRVWGLDQHEAQTQRVSIVVEYRLYIVCQ